MSEHTATISWSRGDARFTDNRYSRVHEWAFDGGAVMSASASPQIVAAPHSDPSVVDPEEAFVASLASCHMLWFLAIAAKRGYCVDRYEDHAAGLMAKNEEGKLAITKVTLHPHATFSGEKVPNDEQVHALHEEAHAQCFIANSVKTEMKMEGTFAVVGGAGGA